MLAEQGIQAHQPRQAIVVGERNARTHLRDVRGRVVIVGVEEVAAELACEETADRGLADAGDAHHDDDHRPLAISAIIGTDSSRGTGEHEQTNGTVARWDATRAYLIVQK